MINNPLRSGLKFIAGTSPKVPSTFIFLFFDPYNILKVLNLCGSYINRIP